MLTEHLRAVPVVAGAGAAPPPAGRRPGVEAARELAAEARAAGLRVAVDDSKQSVGKKIRAAQLLKAPYVVVLGDRDLEAGTFTVRNRKSEEITGLAFDAIVRALVEESEARALDQSLTAG